MGRSQIDLLEILNKDEVDYEVIKLFLFDMSWSRLDTYNGCNARYKFRYIDKLGDQNTVPLALGKAIHETMESIIKYECNDETEAIGFYLSAIEKNKQDLVLSTSDIEDGKYQVLNALEKLNKVIDGDFSKVLGIEQGFKYIIGRGLFVGFIDLILLEEDELGQYINVIDFKTGKSKYKTKKHGQMKLYSLAIKKQYPDHRVKATLYWTRDNTMDTYEFSEEELNEFVSDVRDRLNDIVNDNEFSPNAAMIKCCYCPYANKEICKKGNSNRIIMDKARAKREAKKK